MGERRNPRHVRGLVSLCSTEIAAESLSDRLAHDKRLPLIARALPSHAMKNSARLIFGVAAFCLFISGAAGLVYEIVWARYLALFLGHTSYAVVAVLVAFMGGLALGNIWLGTRADRSPRPLAFYGWLEIGIGVYALIFPFY